MEMKKMSEMQVGEFIILVDPNKSGIGIFKVVTGAPKYVSYGVAKGVTVSLNDIDDSPDISVGVIIRVPSDLLVCPLDALPSSMLSG